MDYDESSLIVINWFVFAIFLFFGTVGMFAWITYGTVRGVLGMLTYTVVGLLYLYPWVIPFVGWLLGVVGVGGILKPGFYEFTLNLSHLESSWMTSFWAWFISISGLIIGLFISIIIIIAISNFLKYRYKVNKTNLALIHCNIIDGNKDSKIIENGTILIKNNVEHGEVRGLIIGVGKYDEVAIPSDYKKIDLKGLYVLPGLINAHCHLIGSGKPSRIMNISDQTAKKVVKLLDLAPVKWLLRIIMKKNIFNALNAGITTLRSMGDPAFQDVKLKELIEKEKILGPRLLVAGKMLCITGGHGGFWGNIADSVTEVRKAIRDNLRNGVDFIKIISTGGVMDARKIGEAGRPQMTVEEIETACFEAHRGNLLVAAHCESAEGIKEALLGGVDSIEHGAAIPDELIPLYKNNPKSLRGYTVHVPTLCAGMGIATLSPKITKITPVKYENAQLILKGEILGLKNAYKSGIKLGVGTDASVPYSTHYEVWKELKHFIHYTGMSAQEAIYFATKGNAENIGIDDITGSVEVGKSADLQIVHGNPLEDITVLGKVKKVVIRGYLINKPKIKKFRLKKIKPFKL
ncbi:MAG: amidohydrolase family protein [Candidatus Helarchaeota archaeon]